MQPVRKPWEPGANTRQRVVPLLAGVVMVAALVYVLVPFTFADAVKCGPALTGSELDPATPAGAIVGSPEEACSETGGQRLVNGGVAFTAALAIGLAGAFLPSEDQVERKPKGKRKLKGKPKPKPEP